MGESCLLYCEQITELWMESAMSSKKKNSITLKDVAQHAGVSRTTASVALSGSSAYVSQETKKKVIASAKELGYVYNRAAASLRSQSSSTIGLIIPNLDNSFYTELLKGAYQEANNHKKTILIGCTFGIKEEQDRLISSMIENRVCGIIIYAVPGTTDDTILMIKNMGIPVVSINRNLPEYLCDYIGINDFKAGQIAAEHFVKRGHENIAFVGGYEEIVAWRERKAGYMSALTANGINPNTQIVIQSRLTQKAGYNTVFELMSRDTKPTAIVCFNDVVALGVIQALEEIGVKAGESIAVCGIDDIRESELVCPRLTSISSYPAMRGGKAVELLVNHIGTDLNSPESIIFEPEIQIRKSSDCKGFK
jgi:LacI family transcriptional regulator